MSNHKAHFRVGQQAKFFRTHDKFTPLTGTIVAIHKGDDDLVDVKTDAGNGSISRVETVHASDVTVTAENANAQPSTAAPSGAGVSRRIG